MNELQKKDGNGAIVKIDKAAFMQKFEPVSMLKEFRHVKTLPQAIEQDRNGLSFYAAHLGEDSILALIELHLVALGESVNVGQNLSKFQIKEIAVEILSIYYHLSMVEIQFVFRKAKRGEFGPLYGALNIVSILDWFAKYAEERSAHFINQSTAHRHNDHSERSSTRREERANRNAAGAEMVKDILKNGEE